MKVAFTFLLLLVIASGYGQSISGLVKDEQGKPLAGASVSLRKSDSGVVKLAVSSSTGEFRFEAINAGKYIVSGTFIGHTESFSVPFIFNGSDFKLKDLLLAKISGSMKEVTVIAKKPPVEVKADKMILNVEGSANAVGQDALELLRKSPGVMVDKDENLSVSGKNGVQVYIDGRPTPLSGKDLADYLKTIQSSSIEAIEIITNPSAKYDAAGNAGIINIRLKKNKSFGTNGSVSAGYNIGITPKYNAGISLNHRNKHINIFGNYTYNDSRTESEMRLYRKQLDTLFDQKSTMQFNGKTHNYKAGLDYFINKRSTIGVMLNGTANDMTFSNVSRTPISYIPTGVLDRVLVADNSSKSNRDNTNINVNYRYADTLGHELNMDADYGTFNIGSNQFQPNYYYDPAGDLTSSRVYNMIAPTDIHIYTFKTDYEQNLKKGKFGVGGKFSYVDSKNDFQRYNVISNIKDLDTLRSNNFNYKENVNAVYVNYNRAFKSIIIQGGLRVENTNAEGRSNGFRMDQNHYMSYDSSFKRNYTDLFPSAAITFNKNPMNQWTVTYSRRIDRPAYQDLNPFEFKLDEYTYQKGNTELRPQYTNSFGITNTFKYKLNTTLNYSHVNDVFTQLIDTAERSKSFMTKKNLATQDITSLNVSYPFQWKWYSVFANLNAYYSKYKADFGTGRKVDLDVVALNIYTQHSIKFGKGYSGEISAFYSSPSIWQGTFETKAFYFVDAGIQKSLWKGKANLKATVSDVFKTMRWSGTSTFAGQYLRAGGSWESRQFKLYFTYRFGSAQIKSERQRKTGLEDENKRVGSQGGGMSN